LYSFLDENMPSQLGMTLMDAAVVSARFPAILPPHSVSIEDGSLRWNFVDGGYSDSSGASTALALYRYLRKEVGDKPDIRVILLTGANPEPNIDPGKGNISGTTFRDTLAPITAVMKVREGLGNQAVARVCDAFPDRNNCDAKPDKAGARLTIVGIEEQQYGLPLGWKLSRATFGVISWMLGRPDDCEEPKTTGQGQPNREKSSQDPKTIVLSNSCVQKSIKLLLERK